MIHIRELSICAVAGCTLALHAGMANAADDLEDYESDRTAAVAEKPEPQQDAIFYRYCEGTILRVIAEDAPGTYALALLRQGEWKPYGRALHDPDGRMLQQEVEGRGAVIFTPHNCEKVPGICRYTETGLDGMAQKKLRINGLADAEWNYSLLDLNNTDPDRQTLTRVGTVRYGQDGLADEETWSSITGTEDGCLVRISAEDLPASVLSDAPNLAQ
ncbi:MAG: hypothetical protein AB8B85_09090 [Paracoccaceae bacterium]